DISPAWLTGVLGEAGVLQGAAVTAVTPEPLGGIVGYLSTMARLHLSYSQPAPRAPASIIAKGTSQSDMLRKVGEEFQVFERMGPSLPPGGMELGEQLAEKMLALLDRAAGRPCSIVHSDLRADNLRFDPDRPGDGVIVLDWQLIFRGLALFDVARLVGGSLAV